MHKMDFKSFLKSWIFLSPKDELIYLLIFIEYNLYRMQKHYYQLKYEKCSNWKKEEFYF